MSSSNPSRAPRPGRWAAALPLLAALAGCASFSPDGGFGPAQQAARARLDKDAVWVRSDADRALVQTRTRELLAHPLSMEDAVQVALLNNPGLQARYADLGIAEADLVQAGRLPNPGFTFSRVHSANDLQITRLFSLDVLQLLALPFATQVEQRRFAQARLAAADDTLRLAAETRRAYVNAVAAQQLAVYADQVNDAAQAGAELAARMARAGNFSKLDHLREQAFYADAAAGQARTRNEARAARERLARVLGLWGGDAGYTLPDRLPDLPAERTDLHGLEQAAMQSRFDVQAARQQTEAVAAGLGLTRATRVVNVLEAGFAHNYETDKGRENGWEVRLEIPLFDWGGARVARAEALYLQAAQRLRETAIDARSEVRTAYADYQTQYDLARHYRDEVVPLRKRVSDETLLRYNGMLASVFELLADAREQVGAVQGAIGALRDYWLADADLRSALGGRLPAPAADAPPPSSTESHEH
ncbi:TolC family protein [Ralstonia solanacearum]|uniref:TolC family protein n=1 Tax=Ralstonia solanacearum TaxID=305 RepID=UPI0018D06F3E|nr:TolC family protein [Ralstonia solanacearum]